MKLNLQQFAGSYTLTVYQDGNFSAASASPSSSLAKDDVSTLTLTPASGYELERIDVISGGATVMKDGSAWKIVMGSGSAVVSVKARKSNAYMITENVMVALNGGTMTELTRNMVIEVGKTGAIIGVNGTPTELNVGADIIASLVSQGILVKKEWKDYYTPELEEVAEQAGT